MSSIENTITQFVAEYDGTAAKVSSAEKKVKQIEDEDDRFFLVRMFSNTRFVQMNIQPNVILQKFILL